MLILRLIALAMFCSSCATGVLQIESVPAQSEVTLINGRGEITFLGKTPIKTNKSRLFLSGIDFVHIRINKEGFYPQSFILSRSRLSSTYKILMPLESKPAKIEPAPPPPIPPPAPPPLSIAAQIDKCEQLSKESQNKLSQGVASIQSAILKREFVVAKVLLNSMITDFSSVSVLHDLSGNIYFLEKNYREARKSYEKSLELDPKNMETAFIVKKLHQQRPE